MESGQAVEGAVLLHKQVVHRLILPGITDFLWRFQYMGRVSTNIDIN